MGESFFLQIGLGFGVVWRRDPRYVDELVDEVNMSLVSLFGYGAMGARSLGIWCRVARLV